MLDWALMFDDDQSVLAFLDHALQRFRDYPDAKRPVAAERYMKFPEHETARTWRMTARSCRSPTAARGNACPAQARFRPGTVIARLFGRALDTDGKPVADTNRQEQYVEDRFDVSPEAQASGESSYRTPAPPVFGCPTSWPDCG